MQPLETPDETTPPTDGQYHAVGATRIWYAFRKEPPNELEIIFELWCEEHNEIKSYHMSPEDARAHIIEPLEKAIQLGEQTKKTWSN